MITRRIFTLGTIAAASSPLALEAAAPASPHLPHKAGPRVRILHAKPGDDGRLLLCSDGPKSPPKLIKAEALDREFGLGTDLFLPQPDHWEMIEEGWFAEEDLYKPTDPADPACCVWYANYRPENEAHDLLFSLFQDRITGPFGAYIPELGLTLAEHPCTPRLATAKVDSAHCLPRLADEVEARTRWIAVKTWPSRLGGGE